MRPVLFVCIALLLVPSTLAFGSITSATFTNPHVETRTLHLSQELSNGRSVTMLTLNKTITEPVLDIRITGYGVGNFSVWLEPVGSDERYMLISSKHLQNEPLWDITGFVAGGTSGNSPGHDPNGPGNSENAPGKNKINRKASSRTSKGISRRRLESTLKSIQGVLKGQERRNARNKALRDSGYLLTPVRFRDTCAHTCALPRPLMYQDYRVVVNVDGKLDMHAIHYTVVTT